MGWVCLHKTPAAEAEYADPNLCGTCHAAIARTYAATGMGRSFGRATASNTIGNRQEAVYRHAPSESAFTLEQREGRIYQVRYQTGFEGAKTNVMEKPVEYVLGSGNHARAFLTVTGRSTLVELILAWYSENGGTWAMNPGYDRPDHPGFAAI